MTVLVLGYSRVMPLFSLPVGRVTAAFYCSPHPTPDLDPEPALVTLFDRAKTTIFFGIYSLTSVPIANALIRAHQRGVDVHGVVDRSSSAIHASKVPDLRTAGIDLRTWGGGFHLFHDKIAVVDNRSAALGSFNWTVGAETRNYETLLITSGRRGNRLVTAMTATLQQGWDAATPLT